MSFHITPLAAHTGARQPPPALGGRGSAGVGGCLAVGGARGWLRGGRAGAWRFPTAEGGGTCGCAAGSGAGCRTVGVAPLPASR